MIVMLIINLMKVWCKTKFLKFEISHVGNVHSVHGTTEGQIHRVVSRSMTGMCICAEHLHVEYAAHMYT